MKGFVENRKSEKKRKRKRELLGPEELEEQIRLRHGYLLIKERS